MFSAKAGQKILNPDVTPAPSISQLALAISSIILSAFVRGGEHRVFKKTFNTYSHIYTSVSPTKKNPVFPFYWLKCIGII